MQHIFKMLTNQAILSLVGGLALATAQTNPQQTYTPAEVAAAQAVVKPFSPVSNVKGLAFDRFVNIWLENTVSNIRSSLIDYPLMNNVAC